MRPTTLWLLVTILAIGSWSLKHDDMKGYASEHPIPKEGISALDIYQDKGTVPEKMNKVDEPSLERSAEEESPTDKYKEGMDNIPNYDNCDNYYHDEKTTTTCNNDGGCGPQRLDVDKRGTASPEDAYDEAEEYDYILDVTTVSPSP